MLIDQMKRKRGKLRRGENRWEKKEKRRIKSLRLERDLRPTTTRSRFGGIKSCILLRFSVHETRFEEKVVYATAPASSEQQRQQPPPRHQDRHQGDRDRGQRDRGQGQGSDDRLDARLARDRAHVVAPLIRKEMDRLLRIRDAYTSGDPDVPEYGLGLGRGWNG
ncbi:hypothetical protein Sjap_004730 [Stephania japonica]|uniref:Uncharacterized protein n=1 Tax=Stephania japonica TaxID=461633 RepID=A0AAP0K506_9MAGN